MNYQPTIGLEIHIELNTKSKMFCGCPNPSFGEAAQNTFVCPVCLGFPGVLPVINEKSVSKTIRTALALNCQILPQTKWDRKNYFYPDLPKGYQISQYDLPIARGGELKLSTNNQPARNASSIADAGGQLTTIRITRVHLEEDTGKLLHPEGTNYSLVDYNRAGVPLMELVTEPNIHSASEAGKFAQELQLILRYLDASDADMEKGQMRIEANISLLSNKQQTTNNQQLGTKVEVKNLNSFRAVVGAIDYEIKRQTELLEQGQKVVQETRGWDDKQSKTYSQREKESAHDYRYFPEPDLPTVDLESSAAAVKKEGKIELPQQKRERFIKDYQIPPVAADVLVQEKAWADYFEKIDAPKPLVANWMIHERLWTDIEPERLTEFLKLLEQGKISGKIGKEVSRQMLKTNKSAPEIIKEQNLTLLTDEAKISIIVDETLKENPKAIADFQQGKEQARMHLIGQIMKKTRGQAEPKLLQQILNHKLEEVQ